MIPWLRKYNLDGVDFDWEFPSGDQAQNYNSLFVELRAAIEAEHNATGNPPLIMSVASFGDAAV